MPPPWGTRRGPPCQHPTWGLALQRPPSVLAALGTLTAVCLFQNGVQKSWDFMKTHDSVTILLFNSSQRSLVLVKQFRPGEASWLGGGEDGSVGHFHLRDCVQVWGPPGDTEAW
uniref:Uncharacterized protein n=1 Tax=Spermophilus dauricus TaxID=99837 RepID=A0A8C9QF50_SPEDA